MSNVLKVSFSIAGFIVLALISSLIWLLVTHKFIDNYELGYKFDSTTGITSRLDRTGWIKKRPILDKVNTIDLRPMQVCINANQRVLNCKLVKFNKDGLDLFLSWHGRADYASGNLDEILKSYAYDGSGRSYPFLIVLRELKNEEVGATVATAPVAP